MSCAASGGELRELWSSLRGTKREATGAAALPGRSIEQVVRVKLMVNIVWTWAVEGDRQ